MKMGTKKKKEKLISWVLGLRRSIFNVVILRQTMIRFQ